MIRVVYPCPHPSPLQEKEKEMIEILRLRK